MAKLIDSLKVAEIFDESRGWVYEMARQGIIPSVRVGRKIKFSEEAIQDFIRSGGKGLPGGWRHEA